MVNTFLEELNTDINTNYDSETSATPSFVSSDVSSSKICNNTKESLFHITPLSEFNKKTDVIFDLIEDNQHSQIEIENQDFIDKIYNQDFKSTFDERISEFPMINDYNMEVKKIYDSKDQNCLENIIMKFTILKKNPKKQIPKVKASQMGYKSINESKKNKLPENKNPLLSEEKPRKTRKRKLVNEKTVDEKKINQKIKQRKTCKDISNKPLISNNNPCTSVSKNKAINCLTKPFTFDSNGKITSKSETYNLTDISNTKISVFTGINDNENFKYKIYNYKLIRNYIKYHKIKIPIDTNEKDNKITVKYKIDRYLELFLLKMIYKPQTTLFDYNLFADGIIYTDAFFKKIILDLFCKINSENHIKLKKNFLFFAFTIPRLVSFLNFFHKNFIFSDRKCVIDISLLQDELYTYEITTNLFRNIIYCDLRDALIKINEMIENKSFLIEFQNYSNLTEYENELCKNKSMMDKLLVIENCTNAIFFYLYKDEKICNIFRNVNYPYLNLSEINLSRDLTYFSLIFQKIFFFLIPNFLQVETHFHNFFCICEVENCPINEKDVFLLRADENLKDYFLRTKIDQKVSQTNTKPELMFYYEYINCVYEKIINQMNHFLIILDYKASYVKSNSNENVMMSNIDIAKYVIKILKNKNVFLCDEENFFFYFLNPNYGK
ncbi:hypothetical protein GVAV_001971 [Gurleya vavrai]